MKKIIFLFCLFSPLFQIRAQIESLGLRAGSGYTFVDIEKAIDMDPLEDWDHTAILVKGEIILKLGQRLFLTAEAGSNRLYYWEYAYFDGYYNTFRWRSEWTHNLNILIGKKAGNKGYYKAGGGIHIFSDGSGTVPGLILESGFSFFENQNFIIPLGLRIESVFGNSTPTSLMVVTGFQYKLF